MSFHRLSPTVNRVLLALAVFTFASWSLMAAVLLAWEPWRSAASRGVARIAERVSVTRRHRHHAGSGLATLSLASTVGSGFAYSTEAGESDFSWGLLDDDGDVWIENGDRHRVHASRGNGELRFWFREGGEEFIVTDPALVADVRRATQPMRELGQQMGELGGEMGKRGAAMGRLGGRMGALSARLALLEVRAARRTTSRADRAEADAASREMRAEMQRMQEDFSAQQEKHAGRQRELSRRMSELSARQQEACRRARLEVREIARRAQREGKAGRPHANA